MSSPKYPILPALVTTLAEDGSLDVASAERLIAYLYECGISGIYLLGSTGEGVLLGNDLRRELTEVTVAASQGKGEVIVHVGAMNSNDAYDLARHAMQAGASAISSIPPFLLGITFPEILDFYRRLADAAGAPVVGYYIPGLTNHTFTLDELRELLALPEVGGLKFTDSNLYLMQRIVAAMRPDQKLYNGPDQVLALGLTTGACGAIGTTYNIVPKLAVAIAAQVEAGDLPAAMKLQSQLNDVIEGLLQLPSIAATKQILAWQGHIDCPRMSEPRRPFTEEQLKQLRENLQGTVLADSIG